MAHPGVKKGLNPGQGFSPKGSSSLFFLFVCCCCCFFCFWSYCEIEEVRLFQRRRALPVCAEVNYYSKDSNSLFVLVLISPHSWCVLPSGRPLIKPFCCRKLDYPSPLSTLFLPPPPLRCLSRPTEQQTVSFLHARLQPQVSFMHFPAAIGWVNNAGANWSVYSKWLFVNHSGRLAKRESFHVHAPDTEIPLCRQHN